MDLHLEKGTFPYIHLDMQRTRINSNTSVLDLPTWPKPAALAVVAGLSLRHHGEFLSLNMRIKVAVVDVVVAVVMAMV